MNFQKLIYIKSPFPQDGRGKILKINSELVFHTEINPFSRVFPLKGKNLIKTMIIEVI